ncbi:MAG: hypothetical protein JJE25_05575, partial [Bacteroidia bacterium]|nr:hypothetical protein [Bacteroidia bacterium]
MLGLKLRLKLKKQIKSRLNVRFIMFVVISMFLISATVTSILILNLGAPENGVANPGSDDLSTGDIICRFTWDNGSVTKATDGPDAISVSKNARITSGGRSSTNGLNPGKPGTPINLMIPGSPYFNVPGIDIGIDFRRSEGSGNFFTRGNSFNFGMEKGNIIISYRIENGKGSYQTINAT